MTDRKAMKQALEALETEVSIDWTNDDEFNASAEKMHEAIAALKERLAQETALQALHDENERLGLYKDAYAEQEPDELNIAYMSDLYDGKKKRPWVGLTVDELITLEQKHMRHEDLSRAIKAKLKEKNT